jgi:hypothetical protein
MINLQKIIDYLEQHNISEETFMISTGLSKSSLIKAKGSLSADDYLTICSTLGVSPWFFYERELTEGSSDSYIIFNLNYTVPIYLLFSVSLPIWQFFITGMQT